MLIRYVCVGCWLLLLSACGGGNGSSTPVNQSSVAAQMSSVALSVNSVAASSIISSSSAVSSVAFSLASSVASSNNSVASQVIISGKITYDYVPHNTNHGLNYALTEQRPVRGAQVELVSGNNSALSITSTSDTGDYQFSVFQNTNYKIRVLAQSRSTASPTWNFSVVDNTSGDAIYSMVGSLASSGTADSIRNLNATSGWDLASLSYTSTRTAAPFAILDSIYTGIKSLQASGNTKNYPTLLLHWSTKNKSVDGNIALGEINTTYYQNSSIYILGDADNDTDEYDPSPILHEFGHYIEDNFFRADSIGGSHATGDSLDLRVSMSEGFANAFSGMLLANPIYEDSSGTAQSVGGYFNLSNKNRVHKGYYDEGSVYSIFYNYYAAAGTNKIAMDPTKIFSTLSNATYINAKTFTSIFTFYDVLKQLFPDQDAIIAPLLVGQNIAGTDQWGTNENNSDGTQSTLPVYKVINSGGSVVNVCSTSISSFSNLGKFNKLGDSAFLKLVLSQAGSYSVTTTKSGGDATVSKPEITIFHSGQSVGSVNNSLPDTNSLTTNLSADTYVIEVYDTNNHDDKNTTSLTVCFDVQVVKN